MQVSENFLKVLRALAMSAVIILLAMLATPSGHVRGETSGTVGIASEMLPVFTNQAANGASSIFQDIGQGANLLFFCNSSFAGTMVIEWSPTGRAPFFTITQVSYSTGDSNCHSLPFGGYWPNLRARVASYSAGSVSAWYSGISGPVAGVVPSIGSNGPTPIPVCDQTSVLTLASGAAAAATAGPLNTNDVVIICGFTVGFNGATAAGSLILEWSSGPACTASLITAWQDPTTASTPQTLPVVLPFRNPLSGISYLCFANTSGASATVNVSFAAVHLP